MAHFRYSFFVGFLLLFSSVVAQNQYNIWYFGFTNAGLDFNGGAPTALFNGAISGTEGCATYCNSSGQILFYTDGDKVFDKTHTQMPGGNLGATVGGSPKSSMQSAVFVPMYDDTINYYLFGNAGIPTGHTTGVAYYTTIDRTLNSGNGDISSPITTLVTGTSERIVGVKHCNGMDHWVVTHLSGTNTFHAFRATKCGVMDTVISSIGPVETNTSAFAPLKASPKGDKLSTVLNNGTGAITSIYDFDNSTGKITGFKAIDTALAGTGIVSLANMFSTNGDLFYLASGATFPMTIYQFNLNAPNINASKTAVGSNSGTMANFALPFDFQIGRDGKLYLCNSDFAASLSSLDAVNNPNVLGMGCAFTNNAVSLGGQSSWLNLPNHISDYLDPLPIRPYTAGFSWSSSCENSPVTFTDTSIICATVKSWKWDFGDPSSGINNTSDLASPAHTYTTTGTYTVSLIISDGCSKDTAFSSITISPGLSVLVSGDTSICMGGSSSITAISSGPSTYMWYPATSLSSSTNSSAIANPTTTTTYSIIATNAGGCSITTLFTVQVDNPDVGVSGNNPICSGDSTSIVLSGASSYVWSPGTGLSSTTGSNVIAFPTTTTPYSIIATTAGGCSDTIPLTVSVVSKPVAQASGNTAICLGKNVTLTASGATNYNWYPSTGLSSTTGASVTASPTVPTTYTVIVSYGNSCDDTTAVSVLVNNLPSVTVAGNLSICTGASTSLTASGASTYTWTPSSGLSGPTGASVTATPGGTASYSVTGTDVNGCSSTFPFTITVLSVPIANAGSDKNICLGASTSLNGSGGGTYTWSNGLNAATVNVSPTTTTIYTLTVSNGSCKATDAVSVTVNPLPTANAGSSVLILPGDNTTLNASGGGAYSWSPATGLSCITCSNPTASPLVTTIYYVTVTDANGCTDTDSLIVTVEDICIENLLVPNVFSPNADGKNEFFVITGFDPCFKAYEIIIYNRWGNIVFQSNSPFTKSWDGKLSTGDLAPEGTYYYALNSKSGPIKGFITLIR